MNDTDAIVALGALAQDHRLATYRQLVRAGKAGMSAGSIAEAISLAPSSLSFHLAQLSQAGLVTQERQHRTIIYRADFAAIDALVGYLLENCCEADGCAASPSKERSE